MEAATMTTSELFRAAVAGHRASDLGESEKLCRTILAADSEHAGALNLLGTIQRQQGRLDEAIRNAERAVAAQSDSPFFVFNLGDCYRAVARLEEAVRTYRRSLELSDSAQTYSALGYAYARLG